MVFFFLGIYQTKNLQWSDFDYLLTLAMYPAIVIFFLCLDDGERKLVSYVWLGFVFISLLYPLSWYIFNTTAAHQRFKTGQSLPSFMSKDHVRYSIFVCCGLLPLLYYRLFAKKIQSLLVVLLLLIIIFLSVRTAWAALIIIFAVYVTGKFKWYYIAVGFLLCAGIAFAAFRFVPTVRQKVNYTIYDWRMYPAGEYVPDFSDGARRTINKVAWKTITEKKRTNTGWKNISSVLQEEFKQQYPSAQLKYGWPFNQYLYWWMGSGLAGLILFSGWLCYPAFTFLKTKNKILLSWTVVIAATCLVESTLNMQYGVFLHAWVIAFAFSHHLKSNRS